MGAKYLKNKRIIEQNEQRLVVRITPQKKRHHLFSVLLLAKFNKCKTTARQTLTFYKAADCRPAGSPYFVYSSTLSYNPRLPIEYSIVAACSQLRPTS